MTATDADGRPADVDIDSDAAAAAAEAESNISYFIILFLADFTICLSVTTLEHLK